MQPVARRGPARAGLLVVLAASLAAGGAACGDDQGGGGGAPCAAASDIAGLRLNQVQVVGSHNSYRRRTYAPLLAFARQLAEALPAELDPDGLDYDHEPLEAQLETYGMRAVELDLYADPEGGRFYQRMGLQFVGEPTASNIPELMQPGLKVLHIPDLDYETHFYSFRSALQALRAWSDGHPGHLPLFVQLETKEFAIADVLMRPDLMLTTAVPFDATAADVLDGEIRAGLGDEGLVVTPDEVRGAHASLEEAVLAGGWPLLEACRGRFVFFMEGAAVDDYVAASPGLRGRLIFTDSQPGQEHAAIMLENGPVGNEAAIGDLVRQGYIVRTMADAQTMEARTGDLTRSTAALASGAHIVSTDYYRPDPRSAQAGSGWTSYKVALPGGAPARVNPVNGGGSAARICD